jgi:hypothetical protein
MFPKGKTAQKGEKALGQEGIKIASGVAIATTEMTVTEWLRDAKHPRFKNAQGLTK